MAVAIGVGLMEYPFADARAFWRWIDMCEAGGVDSFWQTDRLVSPSPILECMTAIAAVAGRTRRMKFGMNVLSLAFRDPVLVAKQCATIDVLSEGRLLPAFGIGNPRAPEWTALSLDTKTRGARTDEALEIITRLWREERVDYDGRFTKLVGASVSPRPVQKNLPLWIGGSSEAAIRRTARYGTGWQAGPESPEEAAATVAAIKTAAAAAGRSIDEDHYGAGFSFYFGKADDAPVARMLAAYEKRTGRKGTHAIAHGDADTIVEHVARYVAGGIEKFVLRPVGSDDESILAQTRRLVDEVIPRLAERWPKTPRAPE